MTKEQPRSVRFPPELLEKLQAEAERNHRSLQNEIIYRLAMTIDGEAVILNKSAVASLDKIVERIGLDRTTLASAAINHYEIVTDRISLDDTLESNL